MEWDIGETLLNSVIFNHENKILLSPVLLPSWFKETLERQV